MRQPCAWPALPPQRSGASTTAIERFNAAIDATATLSKAHSTTSKQGPTNRLAHASSTAACLSTEGIATCVNERFNRDSNLLQVRLGDRKRAQADAATVRDLAAGWLKVLGSVALDDSNRS